MNQMIDRYEGNVKSIFIADRGYETCNIFAHAEQKGIYYLIRVKDGSSGGLVSSFRLPEQAEFDYSIHLIVIEKQSNEVKANHSFSIVSIKKVHLTIWICIKINFIPNE